MAGLGQRFDATAHDTEQRDDYPELPNGVYKLELTAGEVKPTKDGGGTILSVTNEVVLPEEFKGRKLFNNYNLENKSAQAQEIGQKQLASLCRAIGIDGVDDSDELLYKPYIAKVGLGKPNKGKDGKEYPARAEIKRYYFPDSDDMPEPGIDEVQPPKPANDNRAAANDNGPAKSTPSGKAKPWGK